MNGRSHTRITHSLTNDLVHSLGPGHSAPPRPSAPAHTFITHKKTNDKILPFFSSDFSINSVGKIGSLSQNGEYLCNQFINNRLQALSKKYPPSRDWFPPYQDVDGGGGSSSTPLYNRFVDLAKSLNPHYSSFIMPARWMTGGRFLDDFRASMLKDKHISVLYDYYESNICFKDVSIEGGICYFLRDSDKESKCRIITQRGDGTIIHSERYLQERDYDIFIRDVKAIGILEKVVGSEGFIPFRKHVHPRNYYGLDDFPKSAKAEKDSISILGLEKRGRVWKYISSFKCSKKDYSDDMLTKYKVFASKADGAAGQLGNPVPARIMGPTVLGEPNSICTITFLAIGPYDTKEEAVNVQLYMRTKFFRFLVGVRKNKNMYYDNFMFVPVLDFNKTWTDNDLYKKFNLSSDEIQYIEAMISPMSDEPLFGTDELINPAFANFDLLECGVSVGDKIIFTPTGTELIVTEGNNVICEEETMSLAVFTAKYMPRNKRSVSGVCQGPKYFTYNGISLYKLKNSFLGKKK